LLSALFLAQSEQLTDVRAIVTPSDFADPRLAAVFTAMLELHDASAAITLPALLICLEEQGEHTSLDVLSDLADLEATSVYALHYAREVQRLSDDRRRRLLAEKAAGGAISSRERAELRQLLDERPEGACSRLRCLADVQRVEVRWLWPGRVPLGKVTLLDGD